MGISGKGGVMGPRGYLGIRGLFVEGRDSIPEMFQGVMKVKVGMRIYEGVCRSWAPLERSS